MTTREGWGEREREMGRAGQRTRRRLRLRLRRERGQFKSHCIKRQEKPFNLLVTKICYLLNCAIKNENANEPRQDEAALRQEGRGEAEGEGDGDDEANERGSILIYHGEWVRDRTEMGMGN